MQHNLTINLFQFKNLHTTKHSLNTAVTKDTFLTVELSHSKSFFNLFILTALEWGTMGWKGISINIVCCLQYQKGFQARLENHLIS